ncbi:hypothetical protein BSAF29S_05159 [Bacillus safensis subsp. safensis]
MDEKFKAWKMSAHPLDVEGHVEICVRNLLIYNPLVTKDIGISMAVHRVHSQHLLQMICVLADGKEQQRQVRIT